MKKIGLFFGTFNPIHIGHLAIANHIAEHSDLNEIWLVVTPHNPFKKKTSLLDNYHRLEMVYLAIEGYDKLKPSDIEFRLPQPNYTTHTLAYLQEKHPNYEFALIMGEDNLNSFHKWKNYQAILEHPSNLCLSPVTSNLEQSMVPETNIHRVKAPIMEISATFIREEIKNGKNIKPLLPSKVWNYIDEMNFYR